MFCLLSAHSPKAIATMVGSPLALCLHFPARSFDLSDDQRGCGIPSGRRFYPRNMYWTVLIMFAFPSLHDTAVWTAPATRLCMMSFFLAVDLQWKRLRERSRMKCLAIKNRSVIKVGRLAPAAPQHPRAAPPHSPRSSPITG